MYFILFFNYNLVMIRVETSSYIPNLYLLFSLLTIINIIQVITIHKTIYFTL